MREIIIGSKRFSLDLRFGREAFCIEFFRNTGAFIVLAPLRLFRPLCLTWYSGGADSWLGRVTSGAGGSAELFVLYDFDLS